MADEVAMVRCIAGTRGREGAWLHEIKVERIKGIKCSQR